MSHSIELDLVSGKRVALELPPPSQSRTSYFVFMEHANTEKVWPFVQKLLSASARRVIDHSAELEKIGLKVADVVGPSLRNLFGEEGYAFGAVASVGLLPIALDEMGRTTFLFTRDPREALGEIYDKSPWGPLPMYLRSPVVGQVLSRYRQVANFCREREHVKIVRIEDLAFGWYRLAVELVETLGLTIPPDVVLQIANSTDVLARVTPRSTYRDHFDRPCRTRLEESFADVLAYFGYVPEEAPTPVFLKHLDEFLSAASERLLTVTAEDPRPVRASGQTGAEVGQTASQERPVNLVEPDPELGWRLRPNATSEMPVLGRRVVQEVDAAGCRPVLGQRPTGDKTLAAYGCSFTFGSALPFEETFCSLLQATFPRWRVENHGTSGYASAQNLIQLRRNTRWGAADYVTFCWLSDHLLRSVADISWLRRLMTPATRAHRPKPFPRAGLGPDGNLELRHVQHPRWDLEGIDLDDFRPDPFYLDLVAAAIFRDAHELVTKAGGHFFVTVLGGDMSPALHRLLDDARIPVINAHIRGPEYTCLPDDPHPNALANRFYAEKIRDYLLERESQPTGRDAL